MHTGGEEGMRPDQISAALVALKRAMAEDPMYAWSWHCNIAMPIMDATGVSHALANEAAARLMRHLFDIDTSKNEFYWVTQAAPD